MFLRPLTRAGRHWALDNLQRSERLVGKSRLILEAQVRATLTATLSDGLTIAPL